MLACGIATDNDRHGHLQFVVYVTFVNGYRRIRRRVAGRHKYVRPCDTLAAHRTNVAWLDAQLGTPHSGPTVVVTHHAPHPGSLPPPDLDPGALLRQRLVAPDSRPAAGPVGARPPSFAF